MSPSRILNYLFIKFKKIEIKKGNNIIRCVIWIQPELLLILSLRVALLLSRPPTPTAIPLLFSPSDDEAAADVIFISLRAQLWGYRTRGIKSSPFICILTYSIQYVIRTRG